MDPMLLKIPSSTELSSRINQGEPRKVKIRSTNCLKTSDTSLYHA